MFDYLKLYYDELSALCEPGEQPLAQIQVHHHPGSEEIGPSNDTVTFDLSGLDVDRWNRAAEKLIGGSTLISPRGGAAIDLRNVLEAHQELMLTNQRLAVLSGRLGDGAELFWSCRLDSLETIRVQPRLMQAGRLLIAFSDGSALRVMGGVVSRKAAHAFADAFQHATGR